MDFWLEIGIFGAFLALFAATILVSLNQRKLVASLAPLEARISALEAILAAEEEAEHVRLSEQGKKGVEVRESNKEMRQAAMNEGREIMAGGGDFEAKKTALLKLAAKYPLVAEQVAKGLIREFHLEAFESVIMPIVGAEVQKAITRGSTTSSPTASGGEWYGL